MSMCNKEELQQIVYSCVKNVKITDIHTHLFGKCFGKLFLYGIDELLTYHYLVAETFRYANISYSRFWEMSKKERAELVWKTLFIENTPLSEASRSIISIFSRLGLDVNNKNLEYYRSFFASQKLDEYIDKVFDIVNLECVVMTNDPFDEAEAGVWEGTYVCDERFKAALRLDVLLNSWVTAYSWLKERGYDVSTDLSGKTTDEIRRFLNHWLDRMDAIYCAVSLPPDFTMGTDSVRARIIEECILPVCLSRNIPMALMVGVKRAVNPSLKLAGDSLGRADIKAVEYLCSNYPDNKFMVTMLSQENQHELAVTARKFGNLMLFGCWWFLNNPSIIESLTRMRIELLGTSFIPQHSDCRVFEQLISKWEHSKAVIAKVLADKYADLMDTGYGLTIEQVERDVGNLFGGNFWRFLGRV